jgi:hypothetical protein
MTTSIPWIGLGFLFNTQRSLQLQDVQRWMELAGWCHRVSGAARAWAPSMSVLVLSHALQPCRYGLAEKIQSGLWKRCHSSPQLLVIFDRHAWLSCLLGALSPPTPTSPSPAGRRTRCGRRPRHELRLAGLPFPDARAAAGTCVRCLVPRRIERGHCDGSSGSS